MVYAEDLALYAQRLFKQSQRIGRPALLHIARSQLQHGACCRQTLCIVGPRNACQGSRDEQPQKITDK